MRDVLMDHIDSPLPQSAHLYNPLALAYIGDAVYEVYVRRFLLASGKMKVSQLHFAATHYVSAKAQATILHFLLENKRLTEQEADMVRRGRNAKSGSVPRHTSQHEYRQSTAFECLLGYLYLMNEIERLEQLVDESLHFVQK